MSSRQKKIHTWEIILEYIKCPNCGSIIEDRQMYKDFFGKPYKEMHCSRCQHKWIIEKKKGSRFGPLFGDPSPITTEWL